MRTDNTAKFWKSLTTKTRNSLLRSGFITRDSQPWNYSVKELIRIPGIGPTAIAEIATLTEKYCV